MVSEQIISSALFFVFPIATGALVCFLLSLNEPKSKKKRVTLILCQAHLFHLKKRQIAIVDANRCKICLAFPGKP